MTQISIAELATALGAEFAGQGDLVVSKAIDPAAAMEAGSLALAMDPKFLEKLQGKSFDAAVVAKGTDWQEYGLKAVIFVERPRYAMSKITNAFKIDRGCASGVHPTAVVAKTARIGANAAIGAFAVIEDNVRIGGNACILSHTSIGANTNIGNDCLLHSGVRIGAEVVIGDRVIIHQNAVIGSDGFSFVTPEQGAVEAAKESSSGSVKVVNTAFARIHSLGAVKIGDDVEIGASTTIDRGTLRDTEIGSGTKIDNLVQIAHNVKIGNGCLVCAQVGIAGSAVVGSRVVLGGKVGVADHSTIGDDVMVTAATNIVGKVPSRSIMMGSPGVKRDEAITSLMNIKRIPRLTDKVNKLTKMLSKFEDKL